MSIATFIPAPGYPVPQTGEVNIGNGDAFNVGAALISGSGQIVVDMVSQQALYDALMNFPGLVLQGISGSGTSVETVITVPARALQGPLAGWAVMVLSNSGPTEWEAYTFYAANIVVLNAGIAYINNTSHTSGSTFAAEATLWDVFGGGGGGGSVTIASPEGTIDVGGTTSFPTLDVASGKFDTYGAASTAQTNSESYAAALPGRALPWAPDTSYINNSVVLQAGTQYANQTGATFTSSSTFAEDQALSRWTAINVLVSLPDNIVTSSTPNLEFVGTPTSQQIVIATVAPPTSVPSTSSLDSFGTVESLSSNSNYITPYGATVAPDVTSSGMCINPGGGRAGAGWATEFESGDQEVWVVLGATPNTAIRLVARSAEVGYNTGYELKIAPGYVELYTPSGSDSPTETVTPEAGDLFELQVVQSTITIFRIAGYASGGTTVTTLYSATDTTFADAPGYIGFFLDAVGDEITEWGGGDAATTVELGFQTVSLTIAAATNTTQGSVQLNYPSGTPAAPQALGVNTPATDLIVNGPFPIPVSTSMSPTVDSSGGYKSTWYGGIPAGAPEQSDILAFTNLDLDYILVYKFEGSEPASVTIYWAPDTVNWVAITNSLPALQEGSDTDWSISYIRAARHGFYQAQFVNGGTANGNTSFGEPPGWSFYGISGAVG